MKLTGKSKYLLSFFLKNKTINNSNHSNRTDAILLTLYNELLDAHKYLLELKKNKREKFYKIQIKKTLTCLE